MRCLVARERVRWALALIGAAAAALAFAASAQAAGPGSHSQKEINESVEKGVAYLDSQQNEDGSIGTGYPFAETGMALVAYSVLANGSFENLSASYQAHVKKAIEYLLKEQGSEGDWADGGGEYQTYSTGIVLAGLAPFTSVNSGVAAAIANGRKFLEGEFQAPPFRTCTTEPADPSSEYCGGWNYSDEEEDRSDESNTGYALFGLHQSGGVAPSIASVDVGWQHNVQTISTNPRSVANDGGAGYLPSETSAHGPGNDFSSNANDSGTMLFAYSYDGVAASDTGVKAGIKFDEDVLSEYELEKEVSRTMVFHTGAVEDGTCKIEEAGCDWEFGGDGGYHYSMFSLTKGLGEFVPANATEASNWYAKVVDLLLTQQESNGSWPPDGRDDASQNFATALSVSSLGLVGVESHISTSLSGEGKSGEKIAVKEGVTVTDQATLKGTNVENASGTVTYKAYSDSECTKVAAEAGTVTVTKGAVPPSEAKTLPVGTYYWQATYSGDTEHPEATSRCGEEVLTVEGGVSTQPTVRVTFSCTSVTFFFEGFPNAPNNKVKERVMVDEKLVYKGKFTFSGPSGSNTVTIEVPPGHHKIKAGALWNTNGVSGERDIARARGIKCT